MRQLKGANHVWSGRTVTFTLSATSRTFGAYPRPEGGFILTDALVLYTNPMSRGRIARWMLEEVGMPYRTELMEYAASMKSSGYLAINPMGKVPALKHGETVITECAAICAYLADAFPETKLAPPIGSRERGPYFRWMFFAAGPLEAAVTNKSLGFEMPSERKMMAGFGSLPEVVDALDGWLSTHDYVTGSSFTAADVYVGAHLGWGMQFGTLEKRPSFERYFAQLSARPAAVIAGKIDDDLIAQQKKA